MQRRKAAFLFFLVFADILLFPNCALITRNNAQRIPVTSSPVGATVIVNGQQQGVTPLEIRLIRKLKDQVIRIESPGYNPLEIRWKRGISTGPMIGDFFLGAFFGFMVSAIVAKIAGEDLFWSTKPGPYATDTAALIALPAGIIGFPILDLVLGKIYYLKPRELIVTLKKSDGTPRVDTIFVGADEVRNTKWIRVRKD